MLPRKILFCADFSENSVPARICAIEYAKAFRAGLVILHVVNSRLVGYPSFTDRLPVDMALLQKNIEEGVEEELDLLANDSRRDIEDVEAHFRTGAPVAEILRFADEEAIDLIVMGTHGWGPLKHLILGSTAENVVRTASCPVLTVKGSAE
jgi:universal stress protein A